MTGDRLAAAALALVGTPFRLHGRDPHAGLDCLGVLAAACAAVGHAAKAPNGYSLRSRGTINAAAIADDLQLEPASGAVRPGDVLLLRPSPWQLHVAIAADARAVVHAHAGLGKVVIGPLPGHWPLVGHWRLPSTFPEPTRN